MLPFQNQIIFEGIFYIFVIYFLFFVSLFVPGNFGTYFEGGGDIETLI